MGVSRYSNFETVWNDDIQHTQKGLIDPTLKERLLSTDYILYSITLGERYRPDIIAQKFYGNSKYYWILVYVNDINDSPQGFEVNRQIKVPNPSIIGTVV